MSSYETNQIVHATTRYGHIARCGCGWRVIHTNHDAATQSATAHLETHRKP